tara:strand:- start:2085 stop:4070 length:1986 start_codon:yes stop_codon:yes gene_type:complete
MENMQEILPSGGLASFHNEVSRLADLGRYEDAYIVHAAEGETVVPMQVFDENPGLKEMLFNQMREMGIQPERYIVGSEFNSINPITGQPEFFLKKIFKQAKKALKKVAPYAGMIAGVAGLGPGYAALIGAGAPLLAGQGAGEAVMGGISGYGAGRAFGTADYAGGLPGVDMLGGTDNPYIFSKASRDAGIFKTLGSNLGFGGGRALDAETAQAIGADAGATAMEVVAGGGEKAAAYQRLIDAGIIDPKAAITSLSGGQIATLASLGVPIYQALKAEEEDNTGMTMEDITNKYPWGGEFGTTMAIDPVTGQPITYSAEGGIIQHFQDGPGEYGVTAPGQFGVIYPEGDTDFDASEVINQPGDESIQDLDLFMGDDMAANELSNMPMPQEDTGGITEVASLRQPMITVYDVVQERMVTIPMIEYLQNRGRYATQEDFGKTYAAPPDDEQEGFQYDFDVDGENRTYNFDEQLTEEGRQRFLDREGITQMTDMLEGMAGTVSGAARTMNTLAMQIAKARKSSGRINEDDIERAMADIASGAITPQMLARLMKTAGRINEDDIERAQEMLNSVQDYLGPRSEMGMEEQGDLGMADGGIAYLAEGSFPRRTGAIAGPGGPKDDRVPAMLSDGEFVMTAEAVRNAGGGSRRQGAKKMYQLMNRLEGTA